MFVEALMDGFKLMVIGMGWVFIFLTLMVMIISGSAKVLAPFAGLLEDKTVKPKGGSRKKPLKKETAEDKNLVAAVTAAVQKYRQEHK
jgi:oxaloacetate decarboxylase gamma subunit